MGSDNGLVLVRVVEALGVLEVGDVESSDVVTKGQGEVRPLAVIRDVGVDGDGLLGLVSQVVEQLGRTLLAVGVLAERVNYPDLARLDSTNADLATQD